jgi:hypothetical protein
MQCLLFCPDEKSARALTPLVEGLDIVVKCETEVYSAVRSLMAESFDFLIVDCENEPTGRLLLRNAHGSAMNKGALAVAVVAPEIGANALRFGADFLITKPVIAGQAGKVLRRVRTSILRRQQSSPAKQATQTAAVETEPASSQSSNLDLATPVISPLIEDSVETISDGRAASPSSPMVEGETSKIAINPVKDADREDGDSQGGNEQAPLNEELRIELALAVGPDLADPTRAAGVESAPQEEPTTKSHNVAKEAVTEIKKTQSRLIVVSMAAAIGVVLLIVVVISWRIDFEHSLIDGRTPVQFSTTTPAVPSSATASDSPSGDTTTAPAQVTSGTQKEEAPALAPAPLPVVPGELSIDSTPQGAEVRVDAHDDSARVTPPHSPTGRSPRRKSVSTSKPRYAPETRTIRVSSSGNSSMGVQLATATVSVSSDPPEAALWMDGSDTGRMTPAQIVVDKPGDHTFVFKKQGYLDETIATNLRMGQTLHLAPSLHALGRTDEIKMVGKFSKLFGSATAGMGIVKVTTQPKGAQVAVNTRILHKTSPAGFYVNPGNYVIDITLSGFKPVHRLVSVDKGGTVAIDEVMDHE